MAVKPYHEQLVNRIVATEGRMKKIADRIMDRDEDYHTGGEKFLEKVIAIGSPEPVSDPMVMRSEVRKSKKKRRK